MTWVYGLALVAVATGQVEVDLATDGADLSIWGAVAGDSLGGDLAVADLDGDGSGDVVFYDGSESRPGVRGRVCAFFGPHVFPSEHDLLIGRPPTCVEGSAGFGVQAFVAAADIDGDATAELAVSSGGRVAVFRGRPSWPATLTDVDADWLILPADADRSLQPGGVADLNGDGNADLILFDSEADGPVGDRIDAGEVYLLLGPASAWAPVVDFSIAPPDVVIYGADGADDNPFPRQGDKLAQNKRLATGDVIGGDAIDDLVLLAPGGAGPGNTRRSAGEVYVVRGRPSWPASLDLRDGSADFTAYGRGDSQVADMTVTDWDGDARTDLLFGVTFYTHPVVARENSGAVFMLSGTELGRATWDFEVDDATATILGPRASSDIGLFVEAADVNGDGFADLVIGAADDRLGAGSVFVVSGCDGFAPLRDLDALPAELTALGADESDFFSVPTRTGDVDGDGRADILAAAQRSESVANSRERAGEVHLIRGRPFAAPTCTISADPGPDVDVCGTTTDVVLNGAGTVVADCSVAPEYRWLNGTTVVRDWSGDPSAMVRPRMSTVYRLQVRCGDCPEACFASATVTVTVDPDIIPPDLGNTLRAVRRTDDVDLAWGGVAEARTYSLYRGTTKGAWPPPIRPGLTATTETLPDVPGPPDLYFYRVTGASCSGMEGP